MGARSGSHPSGPVALDRLARGGHRPRHGPGDLAAEIEAEATIPYPEIPYFPRSTVESHKGQLVCGALAGQSVDGDGRAIPPLRRLFAVAGDFPDPRDEGAGLPAT